MNKLKQPIVSDAPGQLPLRRFLPVIVVVLALATFFVLGGPKYISLYTLREHQDVLKAFIVENTIWAVLGFILLYTGLVGISFPGASLLSIFAGFLFGMVTGTFLVVIGATAGATLIFLAARSAIGTSLAAKAGPFMEKFETGLQQNELSYLFVLRLVPVFPFFIVNIVPALFNVKLRNYILATMFGIIPGALVYAGVGNGIGDALSAGEDVPLTGLMTRPAVLLPVLGLIVLSLIPVVYKKFKQKI